MAPFNNYQHITFAREGRILTIAMNRPDALNAANAALHSELARVFIDAQNDASSDVVVLTGEGRAFSAGGDLTWMQEAIDEPTRFHATAREAKQILISQLALEKPLIARINGHAAGLGATLAVCCDVAIASEKARISDPHVVVGLVAGDGGALIWPQLVGYMRAREYLLTGDPIPAPEAARIGLITRAVAAEALDEDVYGLARRLAAGATKAIRWTKVTMNLPLLSLINAHADAGLAYEIITNQSEDHAEAVRAFAEGRSPAFGKAK